MKLWQKSNTTTIDAIEKFTVGKDRVFDLQLAPYDLKGSLAHVTMLYQIGLLNEDEEKALKKALQQILEDIQQGVFTIDQEAEDIHSQIEGMLTQQLGDVGKKIHTGRSRNDQVAVDIKLYLKNELQQIKQLMLVLFDVLMLLSEKFQKDLMPGYTHLQVAMPSSFGLWFSAYAESLVDDMIFLHNAYLICDKNPLGSGAGYGSSFPINRQLTTEILSFSSMHYNSIYAQMSRGKTEKMVAMALSSIAATLGKFCMDVCLFVNQNHGFISFPDYLTTGSSIMPHKKNPDVFELVRGKCSRIQSLPNELIILCNNLPSGYHREMQLTKEILFPAIEDLKQCLQILPQMLQEIRVTENLLDDEKYRYVFTVEKINLLVNQGVSFRDAYKQVGDEVERGTFRFEATLSNHTHEGSIGNLCLDQIKQLMLQATHGW